MTKISYTNLDMKQDNLKVEFVCNNTMYPDSMRRRSAEATLFSLFIQFKKTN